VALGERATVQRLAETMRSHGTNSEAAIPDTVGDDWEGFTVCMHRADLHAQTTASMIAELRDDAPLRAWIALGNPCASVYVPAFPPTIAPELADPATWTRFAQLRERAEGAAEDAANVRAALAPVESDLWAEADVAFESGDVARLREFSVGAFRVVDAALRTLGV
jgi:hypothetical protein